MKKKDLFIIGGALLAALVGLGLKLLIESRPSTHVNVYVGGELYASVPATEGQTIAIDQGGGKVNEVVIDEEGVYMASSTCQNQLCVRQGALSLEDTGELLLNRSIICLPNGVSVTLSGGAD